MGEFTTEQLDQLETDTKPHNTFTTAELDQMESGATSQAMFRPIDPNEYVKKAGETWDISLDLGTPLSETKQHNEVLNKSPEKQGEGIPQMMAAPDPTMWQNFKTFFIGDNPPLPPDADRIEIFDRYFKLAVGTPLRTFLKYGKGKLLGAPDVLWAGLKQITPKDFWDDEVKNMTLDQAMDWAAGYNPSGFVKMAGDTAEFMGRLRTVAPIAQRLGIIGNTPKDINWLIKANEYAKLFGTASAIEQIQKATSQVIDPTETEYGYQGPSAVLWDMTIGACLSIAESGASIVFDKLAPSEQARALNVLGLEKGATSEEINATARNLARQYHPDKAKGFIQQFEEVIKARDILRAGEKQDIVFRGQKVTITGKGKLLEGEIPPKPAEITPAKPTEAIIPVTPAPEAVEVPKVRQKDLLGRPILQGGSTGKQLEAWTPEDYKTLAERERINALPDIEGQGELVNFVDHIKKPSQKPPRGTRAGKAEIPTPIIKMMESTAGKVKETAKNIKEDIDQFRFYPNAPPEFRNDVRKNLIGALTKAHKNVFEDAQQVVWGGLADKDIQKSVEIIFAKDQLSRAKLGKGNPEISVEQAQSILDEALKTATPEATAATGRFKTIHDAYTQKLIERGVLDKDQIIEDHIRHFVEDYTPEWAPTYGVPTRLKRPFRGYAKKAVGTTKEYRQDQEAILDSLMEMEHHNLVEDFVENQVAKYDIKSTLIREQRIEQFGADIRGYAKTPRPGRIYIIDGKRYRAYTPDIPFSRAIYMTAEGEAALGNFKNVAVIPEEIFNLFRDFSQRGSRGIYLLNRVTGYWKTNAILSHFLSFSINNFIGDTWIVMVQHPDPIVLLGEYDTAIKYLLGTLEEPYASQLDDFVVVHDIKQTFSKAELLIGRKAKNPLAWLLQKSYQISDFRESINRTAYASSLLKAMQKGNGEQMVEAHDWIDTEGLNTEDALGKISREVLTDYQAVSKPFRRYVSGGVAPFGTFYFKTSARMWKWLGKHPVKSVMAFMALPVAAMAYNHLGNKEKLEEQLPDYTRNRTHFILGENSDGTIRVLSLQLPQDVLIGTKIFSIVTDYGNRVINGEMSAKEAAIETMKRWGISEYEGLKYLLTPGIRLYDGLKTGKDPYDKANVYRRDLDKMTWDEKTKDRAAYFLKCSVPFLGYTIQNYEKGLPTDVGLKKLVDRFAGKGALGIYDINKKGQIIIEQNGKKGTLEFKDIEKTRRLEAQTLKYLGQFEDGYVASGKSPTEYLQSKKAKDSLLGVYDVWAKQLPELSEITDESKKIQMVIEGLDERLTNRLIGPRVLDKWYQTKLARATTDAEKKQLAQEYQLVKQGRLLDTWKTLPKTEREIELIRKIKQMD